MTGDDSYIDQYEHFAERFDPMRADRQARRKRKQRGLHRPKKTHSQIIAEIADPIGLESGFESTYKPVKYEKAWLLSSLRTFYDQAFITDILALVKGGKEANVYRCEAHPLTGSDLLAAKVYRPRMFRNLRNDRMYRQGRPVLALNGRPVKQSDTRIMRALGKKTAFGVQVAHTSWLMYEYTTLQRLYQAGATVPQPFAASENAVLMSYHGDAQMAAPTLNQISLGPDDAARLFEEVLRNIELMLQHNLIHGDLSAYNILYWDGEITLIDFPQVTQVYSNPNACPILQRDITRICEYFSQQGVQCNPVAIMEDLWYRYELPDYESADGSILVTGDETAATWTRLVQAVESEEED